MNRTVIMTMLFVLSWMTGFAAEQPKIEGTDDKVNYSVGHQVGRDLLRQQVQVNPELILQGIQDAVNSSEPMMTAEEMIDTLAGLKERIVKQYEERNRNVRLEGEEFLAENAKNPDIISLPSGLQYKILQVGQGKKPVSGDTVKVNYTSKTIYGDIFDSSYEGDISTPAEFMVDNVIPGWAEGLKLMSEGSIWELYVPYNLAYKDASPMAGQAVIFEIELLQVANK